jgi:hypothetical protein
MPPFDDASPADHALAFTPKRSRHTARPSRAAGESRAWIGREKRTFARAPTMSASFRDRIRLVTRAVVRTRHRSATETKHRAGQDAFRFVFMRITVKSKASGVELSAKWFVVSLDAVPPDRATRRAYVRAERAERTT